MFKVLLVDDEPFILEGLSALINWEELGLEIAGQAVDGEEALAILQKTDISILITDIRMPKLNGLQLIKIVRERELDIRCIVMSGFSDFSFVKEAARLGIENYLLKPVDEQELLTTLNETIDKIRNELHRQTEIHEGYRILRDNVILRWITGEISESELKDKAEFLELNLAEPWYEVAIVKIAQLDKEHQLNDDITLLRFSIRNIFGQLLKENDLGIALDDNEGNILLLITCVALPQKREFIQKILLECIRHVNTILNAHLFISVGMEVTSFRNLEDSYRQASLLQNGMLFLGYDHLIDNSDINESLIISPIDIDNQLRQLEEALINCHPERIQNSIDAIFSKISTKVTFHIEDVQNIVISVLFSMISTIRTINPRTIETFAKFDGSFASIYRCQTLAELQKWLQTKADVCVRILSSAEEYKSPLIKQVTNFITAQYDQNINLKTVAAHFNINPVYLGQIFKNETGELFNNYLNRMRIHRATELLKEGHLSNQDIAEKVGFSNVNYYYTVFKKITGKSPSQIHRFSP